MTEKERKKSFRFPIGVKTIVMIFLFGMVLVEVAMVFFSLLSSSRNKADYAANAEHLAATTAKVVDVDNFTYLKSQVKPIVDASKEKPTSDEWGSDAWNAYTAQFDHIKEMPEFHAAQDFVRKIVEANGEEVSWVYLSYVDPIEKRCVYIVDSAPDEEACPPGCLDVLYEFNYAVIDNPARGFPAYMTNTEEYGNLVTAGSPIYDGEEVVGYAFVDISMEKIRAFQRDNIMQLFFFMLSGTILVAIIGIVIVHFTLVRPVKALTKAANSYEVDDPQKTHEIFQALHPYTHDELADLAESMKRMEHDVHTKIDELTAMNEALRASKQETVKMTELANKDALTGVRNKVAYDHAVEFINKAIEDGNVEPFGVAMIDLNDLKKINDKYGHTNGDVALVKLSKLICETFAHSPVFRIGGDEFVVLLRQSDFAEIKKLVASFNKAIKEASGDKSLAPAERISAAIGVSSYDREKDNKVEDIFRRADSAMYEKKRAMKAKAASKEAKKA
jgi:diguanylate cyclase (GGDEF)-like protein